MAGSVAPPGRSGNRTIHVSPSAETATRQIIAGAAAKYGINPRVLWGVYGTESGYGKNTGPSSAGAVGPFQFEPSTAQSLGVNPLNFRSAAYGAANYLSQYKDRGVAGMLSAYNAGPNGALQPGYVQSVLQNAKTYAPTASVPVQPNAQAPTAGVPRQPSAEIPTAGGGQTTREALASALLRSGGKGLTAGQLLGAIRPTAATTAPPAAPTPAAGDPVAGSTPMPSSQFQKLIGEANKITGQHSNYEWGGGHNPSFSPSHGTGHGSGPGIGYDCSGAISALLHSVGKLNAPMVASQFMTYGQPGPGGKHDLTIYASPTHVFAEINGRFFGTSLSNPGGGAGWFQEAQTAGYVVRHVSLQGAPSVHLNQQTGKLIPYRQGG